MKECKHIAVIGAGAMGGAVTAGLLAGGYDPACITISNPHREKLEGWAAAGCHVMTDNREAIRGAELVVVAVKPWIVADVARELKELIPTEGCELALIVAGVPGEELGRMWSHDDGARPQMSIVMPNTAVALGQSMTFMVRLNGDNALTRRVFESVGTVRVIEERLLPAATALASCGIAYALRYIRAAVEGGVELGFKAAEAQDIVAQTVAGAAALLARPGAHAEAEIDKVTTPGGLTIRGLNAMEDAGFTAAVMAGLRGSLKK